MPVSRGTRTFRRLVPVFVFGLLVLSIATPAAAITYGSNDTAHTFVGAILIQYGTFYWELCSGSLVSPHVFLTAGHCTDYLIAFHIPTFVLSVSFAPNFRDPGADHHAVAAYFENPAYHWGPMSDPHDTGVIILADAVTGIGFTTLAPLGYLDSLAESGYLPTLKYINVGYGQNQDHVVTGDRQISTSSFRNLHEAWLYMSQNNRTGNGGTCYGDSGGPTFVFDPTMNKEVQVAVTSWGDTACKSTNNNYRVDIADSLDFIHSMVDLHH